MHMQAIHLGPPLRASPVKDLLRHRLFCVFQFCRHPVNIFYIFHLCEDTEQCGLQLGRQCDHRDLSTVSIEAESPIRQRAPRPHVTLWCAGPRTVRASLEQVGQGIQGCIEARASAAVAKADYCSRTLGRDQGPARQRGPGHGGKVQARAD